MRRTRFAGKKEGILRGNCSRSRGNLLAIFTFLLALVRLIVFLLVVVPLLVVLFILVVVEGFGLV